MDKGKGKVKEVKEAKSGLEFGFRELVEELQGLRQDLRELQTDFRRTHCVAVQIANQMSDVADNMEDLTKHFVPYLERGKKKRGFPGTPEGRRMMGRRLYSSALNYFVNGIILFLCCSGVQWSEVRGPGLSGYDL